MSPFPSHRTGPAGRVPHHLRGVNATTWPRVPRQGKRGSPPHLGRCESWRRNPEGLKLLPELARRTELNRLHP
jgi:hypothetical protein